MIPMLRKRALAGACILLAASLLAVPPALAKREQIGRMPSDAAVFDRIAGLAWTIAGDGAVTLRGRTPEGEEVAIGRASAAVVFAALLFAADGRPFVVGTERASPLVDDKLLLHPVLIDTALGCRVFQLDRYFSDSAGGADRLREEVDAAAKHTEALVDLYSIAWARRFMHIVDAMAKDAELGARVRADRAWDSILRSFETARHYAARTDGEVESLLTAVSGAGNPFAAPSLLSVKASYFQPEIVQRLATCANGGGDPRQINACLKEQPEGIVQDEVSRPFMIWAAPPPGYRIQFGVGETPFAMADMPAPVLIDPRTPFDQTLSFAAWVEFTSLPAFLPTSEPWYSADNTEALEFVDEEPYPLDSLSTDLNASVEALIASDAYWRDTMEAAVAFARLQRLFRLGFAERLGDGFQLADLARLGEEVAPLAARAAVRTPRWQTRPGVIERLAFDAATELRDRIEPFPPYAAVGEQAAQCIALIQKAVDGADPQLSLGLFLAAINEADWEKGCGFEKLLTRFPELKGRPSGLTEEQLAVQDPILRLTRLDYARRIRAALDVAADDRINPFAKHCPVP